MFDDYLRECRDAGMTVVEAYERLTAALRTYELTVTQAARIYRYLDYKHASWWKKALRRAWALLGPFTWKV